MFSLGILRFLSSFEDFFNRSATPYGCTARITSMSGDFYIVDCLFTVSKSYAGYGGIMFIDTTSSPCHLLIESTTFSQCSVGAFSSGAIYYSSYSGSSVLKKVCAYGCFTGHGRSYQFGYFGLGKDYEYKAESTINEVHDTSISRCSPSHSVDRHDPIILVHGAQTVDNMNSSYNNVRQNSGIRVWIPNTLKMTYCTFMKNNATHSVCLHLHSGFGNRTIGFINIVGNNSPSGFGVVYAQQALGNFLIHDSIFFSNANCLFYLARGALRVANSRIMHSSGSTTISGSVSLQGNNASTTSTYDMSHFSTHLCFTWVWMPAQTPSITTLPPATPVSTPIPTASPQITPDNTITLYKYGAYALSAVIIISIGYYFIRKCFGRKKFLKGNKHHLN